ncbi:MAG: GtrA family protein, partial [Clostridiales bacterium]|nr:GtrA family protein [Clostridiales bacterium]
MTHDGKQKKGFRAAHPAFCEIVRFLFVGTLATLTDMFVMGVVLYAFDPALYPHFYNVFYGGGNPATAATVVGTGCGFAAGLIVNYVLSVLFVFEHKGRSKSVRGFVIFAVLSAIGLCIHLLGMYIGYSLLHGNEWVVKILLTCIVLVYNYLSRRFVLFTKAKTDAAPVCADSCADSVSGGGVDLANSHQLPETEYGKISIV